MSLTNTTTTATPVDDDRHLDRLTALIGLMKAAKLLGIGATTAYKLVRRGEWPTPILRIGRQIRIPTAPLRELLNCSNALRSG
jgi:excisionase family DNA binding protein